MAAMLYSASAALQLFTAALELLYLFVCLYLFGFDFPAVAGVCHAALASVQVWSMLSTCLAVVMFTETFSCMMPV
jgi:hypothetical protein